MLNLRAIGSLIQTIGRWLAKAGVVALAIAHTRGSLPPVPASVVAWVGTSNIEADVGYRMFAQAIQRLPANRRDRVRIEYVAVRDEGPEAAHQDLMRRSLRPPAVWIAPTADTARAVRAMGNSHRLVFATFPDPVLLGLVDSVQRPGGPATGVLLDDELHAKRLELLRDAFPRVRLVGVLLDRSWTETREPQISLVEPANGLGMELRLFFADQPDQVDAVMASSSARSVDAWYIPATYIAYRAERSIIEHLHRLRQPAIHATSGEVARGALMAYSRDSGFVYGMLAELATRVAAGEDPGSIPVQRSLRYVLSVRPRDEPRELRIQPSVIRRADRVY